MDSVLQDSANKMNSIKERLVKRDSVKKKTTQAAK